jgi:glutaredoxin
MVTVYTIKDCPYCSELKGLLKENEIEFNEIDIYDENYKEEVDKVMEISKADQVPIVRVGAQLLVPDVSFQSINECLEITKRFLG